MTIYKSCSDISIWRFYQVVETGDLLYLVKEYEGKDLKVSEDLEKVWEDLYSEYCDLSNDNSSLEAFKVKRKLAHARLSYFMSSQLLLQIVSREDMKDETRKKYIEALRGWGVPLKGESFDLKEISKAGRHIRALKNNISRYENKLDSFKSGEPTPLTKQVVLVEQALGRNMIDPKKTSVEKWVYMIDAIKDMNRHKSKLANSGKL